TNPRCQAAARRATTLPPGRLKPRHRSPRGAIRSGCAGKRARLKPMATGILESFRRFLDWLREGLELPADGSSLFGRGEPPDDGGDALECPWRYRWDHLPKRTAGFGFSQHDYEAARARAEEIARVTLGADVWSRVKRIGYVDLPSGRFAGVTYRL